MGGSEAIVACSLAAILWHAYRCGSVQLPVPLGSTTDVTCSNTTFPSRWEVKLNRSVSTLRLPGDESTLAAYGIASSKQNSSSILHVNGSTSNNGTTARCVELSGSLTVILEVTLAVYEPPSPPTELNVSATGNGALVLKWQPPFAPSGVMLQYRVTLYNLLTPPPATLETVMVKNCSYTLNVANWDISQCSRYEVSVLAVNKAGESDSIKVQVSLPAVPQISTQQHLQELVFSGSDMAAFFRLRIHQNCSDFPIQSYIVRLYNVLQDTTVTVKCQTNVNNCSAERIIIHTSDGLQPNMKYICTITAANMYGSSTTFPQTLYTTDVQSSTITGSDHQLNVTCFFARGTLAKGCVVCLEKSGDVVYQRISIVNGTAKGVIRTQFSVDCYNISVVDWEEDGSIGSLITQVTIVVAPVNIIAVPVSACMKTTSTSMVSTIENSTQGTDNIAFAVVPSTYSVYQALSSHLPTSSVSDSSILQLMLWLIPVSCSITVALIVATICFLVLHWRVKALKAKRNQPVHESSEREERIYEAVLNQRPIYATLEPPPRINATNPTYMIDYESNAYSSDTAATNEYAIPADITNDYALPDNVH